jgi:protein associated with RNAse G/E
MSDKELSDTLDAHIYVLAEIDMVNKKKVEAVDNEDFELAAKYKHQANDLRNKLLTTKKVLELMRNRPALTLRELLDLMLGVDTKLHFMANLLD